MKHLDELFDELQEPISQLMDWCDADKDRAVVACLLDLLVEKSTRYFDVLFEAYPDDYNAFDIASISSGIIDQLQEIHDIGETSMPFIEYDKLYQPLEHIINDRIDLYNRS